MGKLMTALAATAAVAGSATAFYFPGWPADGLPRPATLYAAPPGQAWPVEAIRTESLLSRPPSAVLDPVTLVPARTVPEPTTFLLAAAGLTMVRVMYRRPGSRVG